MRDVVVISACDLVKPLEVLVIRHEFIDPMHGFLRVHVIRKRIFFDLDKRLKYAEEGIDIAEIKMQHHLLAIQSLDVNSIIGSIEPLLVYFLDIREGDAEVVEGLVLECLGAHVIEGFVLVAGVEDYEALGSDCDAALDYC